MPICMRDASNENESKKGSNKAEPVFNDNEEVFYCETTKRIFRDYEEYFRHVMLINSTIWVCESTGRENLTYAEALKSEKRFRKRIDAFKDTLKGAALLVVEKSQQSSIKELTRFCYLFIRERYFLGEEIQACTNSTTYHLHKVVGVKPIDKAKPPTDGVYDNSSVEYTLERVTEKSDKKDRHVVSSANIRRHRQDFSTEIVQLFVKDNVRRVEGILKPKIESYKKYVTDAGFSIENSYYGKMPQYKASKPKVDDKSKKQATLSKYFKNNDEKPKENDSEAAKEKSKTLKAEMERVRKEKEEKLAAEAKRKLEFAERIEQELLVICKKSDDLERRDQKLMPTYRPIKTIIPNKYLGDCLMLHEFFHSFVNLLSGYAVFRNNITFFELTRAFTAREVAGPLSDILLILLGTIFDLQKEEEEECPVEYAMPKITDKEPYTTIALARKAHKYVRSHLGFALNQLPIDCQTFSEVLRLHLLASGSSTNEKTEKWRVMYRNGYHCTEDPGLWLRMQCPHIVRALKMYTVFQLPFSDILKIIQCLVNQILTYSSSVNAIDERMESIAKARYELRLSMAAENKRTVNVTLEKKKLQSEFYEQCQDIKNDESKKKSLEDKLNKQIAEVMALSDRDKKKFEIQLDKFQNSIFDHMVILGMDRAYRKYYVFEAIPGIFIEHPTECNDVCMQNPPNNWTEIASVPKSVKEMRVFLTRHYRESKIKSKVKVDKEADKENQQTVNGKLAAGEEVQIPMVVNGIAKPAEKLNGEVAIDENHEISQYDLMMCTGNPKHCIVHDEKNPDRHRWSYIHTADEVESLLESLNPLGDRESALKEQISSLKLLIINHIQKCPVQFLSLDDDEIDNKFRTQVGIETNRRYQNANFTFGDTANLDEVMCKSLIERILQFEMDITTGFLGKMKVKNIEKWRSDIENNTYDPQGTLKYGFKNGTVSDDPGESLGDTMDIESEDSADDSISLHESSDIKNSVKNLSSAVLQIEQSLEQKFLKEPFGIQKETKDKDKMEMMLEKGRERLQHWETSLMSSTSYSQIFLHMNIIHDSIKWQRSVNKSNCQICHRKSEPEKMLLCDECNAGTHMFCMKPKMKDIPEGNWYCKRCVDAFGYKNENSEVEEKKKPRKRNTFHLLDEEDNQSVSSAGGSTKTSSRGGSRKRLKEVEIEEQMDDEDVKSEPEVEEEQEEEDDEEITEEDDTEEDGDATLQTEEDDEETDEDVCTICSYDGGELSCFTCKSVYHLECADLRRVPRNNWTCNKCKTKDEKKRKNQHNESSSDSEAPLAKRNRQPTSKRNSTRNSIPSPKELNSSNNNNRRSRRTGEHLPLNSVILYELLDEISKHEDGWPFLRPVTSSEVPDYFDIIKNPMDFSKVKSKLNMGQYRINEELLKDIQLVFRNCDTYNEQGNEIYTAGEKLEKFVMKKCKEMALPYMPSDMNSL